MMNDSALKVSPARGILKGLLPVGEVLEMGYGDDFNWFGYASDDGKNYVVKLAAGTATAGSFAVVADPLAVAGYPYGPKNMRHVWGVSGTGKRARVPIADPDNPLFKSGGNFSLHGTAYTIQGAIGEARKLSFLGG